MKHITSYFTSSNLNNKRQCVASNSVSSRESSAANDSQKPSESTVVTLASTTASTESLTPADHSVASSAENEEITVRENETDAYTLPINIPAALKPQPLSKYDICLAVNNQCLKDSERIDFLDHAFKPQPNYVFKPVLQSKRLRKVQWRWFNNDHVAFSHVEHGFYCKTCVIFGKREVGQGSNNNAGKFVTQPYRRFKDFDEDWKNHLSTQYHNNSCVTVAGFKYNQENKTTIVQQIDSVHKENIKKNREILKIVLDVLRFVARYELPLHGDKDYSPISLEEPDENDGVFRGVLRLMLKSGDERMKLLLNAPSNATYLSPKSQNQLLNCYAKVVVNQIADSINKACMFTILADETSSAAKEFITIAVRYVDEKCLIREAFLGFQNVSETTGETLCLKIVDMLKETGIELSSLIGQGYDGAANMAGHKKGVQS